MISLLIVTSFLLIKCDKDKENEKDKTFNFPLSQNRMDSTFEMIRDGDQFLDITHMISYDDFEKIKTYILSNGDRKTYCNMYNGNPHHSFSGFEAYLNPEIGQRNINCDPELSDFNEILIRDHHSDPQYFHLLIVRHGDLDNEQIIRKSSGMIEGKIYLLKRYKYDLEIMAEKVRFYIDKMTESIE